MVFAVFAAAILLLPLPLIGNPAPQWVSGLEPSGESPLAAGASHSRPTAGVSTDPTVSPGGAVLDTLDLANGDILPNNTQPPTCSDYTSVSVAPWRNEAIATCQFPDRLLTFNESTGAPGGNALPGTNSTDVTADEEGDAAWVANEGSNSVSMVSLASAQVTRTIGVSGHPDGLALDPLAGVLYVVGRSAGNVTEINTSTGAIVGSLSLQSGAIPVAILFDPFNQDLYVAEQGVDAVEALSIQTNSSILRIPLPGSPMALAFGPAGGAVYVGVSTPSAPTDRVVVISAATGQVVGNVSVGVGPDAITYVPSMGAVYVANSGSNNLTVINATSSTVLGSIVVGSQPSGLAYDPARSLLFVADALSSSLAEVDLPSARVLGFLSVNPGPDGIAWDRLTASLVVANQFGGTVESLNVTSNMASWLALGWEGMSGVAVAPTTGIVLATSAVSNRLYEVMPDGMVEASVRTGAGPLGIAVNPNSTRAYVANSLSGTLGVLRLPSVASISNVTLPGGTFASPVAAEYDSLDGDVYVAESGCICSGTPGAIAIYNVSKDSVIGGFYDWAGPGPSALALDEGNNTLYVADASDSLLWGFDLTSGNVTMVTTVGSQPEGVAYDPANGYLYVSSSLNDTVTVLDAMTGSRVGTIPVGVDPVGVAVDPATGRVYVANQGSGTISVIGQRTYPVTFTESGLPPNAPWRVTCAGSTDGTTGSEIQFALPNGTFPYTVDGPAGFAGRPPAGNLTVDGWGDYRTAVVFDVVPFRYNVSFISFGGPTGATWSVYVDNSSFSATGPVLVVAEANGTYSYSIVPPPGYRANPANGVIMVGGAARTVTVQFSGPAGPIEPPSPSALAGLPWLLLGLGSGLAAGAAVLWWGRRIWHGPPR